MKIAIIGGGAAGFFSAITAKEHHPKSSVTIFEKSHNVLSKVKISGGGRCNLTNGCTAISSLSKAYPRGEKFMKKALREFSTQHTIAWFEKRGVPLVIQDDNCVFPESQDSHSIINCLINEANKLDITIKTGCGVNRIETQNEQLILHFISNQLPSQKYDKVIVTTGGSPQAHGLKWLEDLHHEIMLPVPSLFTFNMPHENIKQLMGVVVNPVRVTIQGTKFIADGPLLITHWGVSGPAILKLSAYGARWLHEHHYHFTIQVNWVNEKNHNEVTQHLEQIIEQHPHKLLTNYRPYALPERLWLHLIEQAEFPAHKIWGELGKKGLNKLITLLTNSTYQVKGKSTFKEEFVTCGGVSLQSIHHATMESIVCENLYFAGEVLDIDAITGGFNLQAAWTTGFIAGKLQ